MIIDIYNKQPEKKLEIVTYYIKNGPTSNDAGDAFSVGIDFGDSKGSYTSFTYNNSQTETVYVTGSYFYDPLWSM